MQLEDAVRVVDEYLAQEDGGADRLVAVMRAPDGGEEEGLSEEVLAAARVVRVDLLALLAHAEEAPDWVYTHARAALVACEAEPARRDVLMGAMLVALAPHADPVALARVARARVVNGPLVDALRCVPFLGHGEGLLVAENHEAVARLEILIWEAGASAREVPELGQWLWSSADTFKVMVEEPAHSTLLGRVLAARTLEIAASGMPETADPKLVGRTLQILQPLLLHPEPLVWVHAARALGRLTGPLQQLEGTLLDWVLGDTKILRQRATTAFASLPADRLSFLSSQLVALVDGRDDEGWVLAAIGAATPYLFFEKRAIWNKLYARVMRGDGGAISARALARGLATLWRRGHREDDVASPLQALRERAREARPTSFEELRRWIEVVAVTDPIDGAERDPLDLELGLENLVRLAAQYDDNEADARAARFASTLHANLKESLRIVVSDGRRRVRAGAVNALEGCARAFALRLWVPLLVTTPGEEPIEEPDLLPTWKAVKEMPATILDLVAERRARGEGNPEVDVTLEVLALRLGGYALDACGTDADRGATANDTCRWLRKVDGLTDGSRELPSALKSALSSIFWRLVDTTRGTALGEVDDVRWLGPFAAWWALVIDRPAVLQQLAMALPLIADGALSLCCTQAEALRTTLSRGAPDGEWASDAALAMKALRADGTELAHALGGLAKALGEMKTASGRSTDLEARALQLVLAGSRLHGALEDPMRALHEATEATHEDSLRRSATENAPRVASLVVRAVRARDLSMLEVWLASLGPVAAPLLESALRGAVSRTPPPPPTQKKEPKVIEGYELVKPLGEGGIGSVWLVRKPGADRLFVLKIPKADALAAANEVEREGILASFVEEAKALAGLYHPNVANIIDRGVSGDVPFLVLEYLIGADLKQYSWPKMMTLFELRQVVLDSCAGLSALHNAGLVHRDIKPANIWLRLPLAGGEQFDPKRHRDPAQVPPLAAVVIDFGMVRATRVTAEVGGKFVAGTAGYIAPEQVLDPVELDPRADVYALAGTVYNVTTHRALFDDIENQRDRIIAHMRRDPFEDASRLAPFPAGISKLLRASTAQNPADRPSPLEFGREFVASL
jgi:serine/threonine-protein kinase